MVPDTLERVPEMMDTPPILSTLCPTTRKTGGFSTNFDILKIKSKCSRVMSKT